MSIKRIGCYKYFIALLFLKAGVSYADQKVTLLELQQRVDQALSSDKHRASISDLTNAKSTVATSVLGATELEFESEMNEKGKSTSQAVFLNQPLRFNFSAGQLKESVALDAKISEIELLQQVRSTTIQLAKSIAEAVYVKKQIAMLTQAVTILKEMSNMVAASRGQATAIAVEQIADKLRHKVQELKAYQLQLQTLEKIFESFSIAAGTSIDIAEPGMERVMADIQALPEVKIANLRAASTDSLAAAEAGKFDMEVGLGTQKDVNAGDKSYVVRLSAPIGQAFVNRYEASRLRSESAVIKAQVAFVKVQAKQGLIALFSELEHTKTLLASQQQSQQTAEKLYSMSKQGFSTGIVPFDDLNDAFDRLLEATTSNNTIEKQYQNIKLEISNKAGGFQ